MGVERAGTEREREDAGGGITGEEKERGVVLGRGTDMIVV